MNGIAHIAEYLEAAARQFPEGALRLTLISMLGLVLLWSGSAKARSPRQTAFALVDFGVVKRPGLRLAWGLIVGEFLLGMTLAAGPLLPEALVFVAAVGAAATFTAFSVLIGRSLARGQAVSCSCFGSSEKKLTRTALYRSGALGLVALVCAAAGSLGPAPSPAEYVLIVSSAASILGVISLLAGSREAVELSRAVLGADR